MTKLLLFSFGLLFLSASVSTSILTSPISVSVDNKLDSTKFKTGLKLFKRNCAICHSIKKMDLVGPTLNGIEDRHSRKWITKFMLDSGFRKSDKTSIEVVKKYQNAEHPDFGTELTKKDVALILDFIKAKVSSNDLTISFKDN